MTQALINPAQEVQYISSWELNPYYNPKIVPPLQEYNPIYSIYANSQAIWQIELDGQTFEVASPLYWLSCPDTTVAYEYYYDSVTLTYPQIVNTPYPVSIIGTQPISSGTQKA